MSYLWHLAKDHQWRQFWLFGMGNEEAQKVHSSLYPDCRLTETPESDIIHA